MALPIVRKIEDKVVRNFKKLATKEGVSVEDEHRRVLRETLVFKPKPKLNFLELLSTPPDLSEPDKLRPEVKPRESDLEKSK